MLRTIIDETDIDNYGDPVGPILCCIYCHEAVRTQIGLGHELALTIYCPGCMEDFVDAI